MAIPRIIGLIAHICIEATVRFTAELGYQVTVVKDTTADYSDEMMHAALTSISRTSPGPL
jgi:nicotinamidase-related amidase